MMLLISLIRLFSISGLTLYAAAGDVSLIGLLLELGLTLRLEM